MDKRWLSVDEIAIYLGISKETVYKWIPRKHLPAHKAGKFWKFNTKEVDEWVRLGGARDLRKQEESSSDG